MTFDPNAQLDPGQITDRRGMGGRGGLAIGGGGTSASSWCSPTCCSAATPPTSAAPPGARRRDGPRELGRSRPIAGRARTPTSATTAGSSATSTASRPTGPASSRRRTRRYEPVNTILFSGVTSSGCGTASSATGPFYCPRDQLVYLDLDFFEELRSGSAPTGGSLAQGYVVAHEYGHHVQDLPASLGSRLRPAGAQGRSVRTELQADCFAGVWANHAAATGFLKPFTDAQIADALDAAAAVGDDRIQQATSGQVDPDSWTHGSSAQRQRGSRPAIEAATRRPATRSPPRSEHDIDWHVSR